MSYPYKDFVLISICFFQEYYSVFHGAMNTTCGFIQALSDEGIQA